MSKQGGFYDSIKLKESRIINDKLGDKNIVLVLLKDDKSFFAFENPDAANSFTLQNDTLVLNNFKYSINGKAIGNNESLKPLPAYQEFWHSWKTFNTQTLK